MNIKTLIPRVPRNYLLLIAALVWTFAGVMLLARGYLFSENYPENFYLRLTGSILAGLLFYFAVFQRISAKHIKRIYQLQADRPVVFTFFNLRSYILMFSMISGGILLRKSALISTEYLALLYLTMGTPLLLSSIRFYLSFFSSKIGY